MALKVLAVQLALENPVRVILTALPGNIAAAPIQHVLKNASGASVPVVSSARRTSSVAAKLQIIRANAPNLASVLRVQRTASADLLNTVVPTRYALRIASGNVVSAIFSVRGGRSVVLARVFTIVRIINNVERTRFVVV
jgi:hypothetical protein